MRAKIKFKPLASRPIMLLTILLGLLISGCDNKGGNSEQILLTPEIDKTLEPVHQPLDFRSFYSNFTYIKSYDDGTFVGRAKLTADNKTNLFKANGISNEFSLIISGKSLANNQPTYLNHLDANYYRGNNNQWYLFQNNQEYLLTEGISAYSSKLSPSENSVMFTAVKNEHVKADSRDILKEHYALYHLDFNSLQRQLVFQPNAAQYIINYQLIINDKQNVTGVLAAIGDETTGQVHLVSKSLISDNYHVIAHNIATTDSLPVIKFKLSPDQSYVVYFRKNNDINELYYSTLTDSLETKLNGQLVEGGNVLNESSYNVQFSSDSQHIFYVADATIDEVNEWFRVGINGMPPVSISQQQPIDTQLLIISQDSEYVAYLSNDKKHLYSQSLMDNQQYWLNENLGPQLIGNISLAADDRSIIYYSYVGDSLFGAKINEPNAYLVSGKGQYDKGIDGNKFVLDQKGEHVAFVKEVTTANREEIYIATIDGNNLTNITPKQDTTHILETELFGFIDDNFYFRFDGESRYLTELYKYNTTNDLVENISRYVGDYISEDITFATTSKDGQATAMFSQLPGYIERSVFTHSYENTCQSSLPDTGSLVQSSRNFFITSDNQYLIYTVWIDNDTNQLHQLNLTSCENKMISSEFPSSAYRVIHAPIINKLIFSSNNGGLFISDIDGNNVTELTPTSRANRTGLSGGNNGGFELSNDENWVVFISDHEQESNYLLYSVATESPHSINKLSDTALAEDHFSFVPKISADNLWVTYPSVDGNIYKTRLDGSTQPVIVNEQAEHLTVNQKTLTISPNGKDLYYTQNDTLLGQSQIVKYPLDGSLEPQVIINDIDGTVEVLQDSNRLLFLKNRINEYKGSLSLYEVDSGKTTELGLFLSPVEQNFYLLNKTQSKLIIREPGLNFISVSVVDLITGNHFNYELSTTPEQPSLPFVQFINDHQIAEIYADENSLGLYVLSLEEKKTSLLHELPKERIGYIQAITNNEYLLLGDYRMSGVMELFSFPLANQ